MNISGRWVIMLAVGGLALTACTDPEAGPAPSPSPTEPAYSTPTVGFCGDLLEEAGLPASGRWTWTVDDASSVRGGGDRVTTSCRIVRRDTGGSGASGELRPDTLVLVDIINDTPEEASRRYRELTEQPEGSIPHPEETTEVEGWWDEGTLIVGVPTGEEPIDGELVQVSWLQEAQIVEDDGMVVQVRLSEGFFRSGELDRRQERADQVMAGILDAVPELLG